MRDRGGEGVREGLSAGAAASLDGCSQSGGIVREHSCLLLLHLPHSLQGRGKGARSGSVVYAERGLRSVHSERVSVVDTVNRGAMSV